jgi:hypothetical protein
MCGCEADEKEGIKERRRNNRRSPHPFAKGGGTGRKLPTSSYYRLPVCAARETAASYAKKPGTYGLRLLPAVRFAAGGGEMLCGIRF